MAIRRRLPGDPFRVRAAEWNDIVDTVQRVRNTPGVGGGSINDASIIGGGIIRVKNTTAQKVPQYGVLAIASGPLMPPTASIADASTATYFSQIVMKGHLPKEIVDSDMLGDGIGSSAHAFCITLEPLLPGVTGYACVSGLIHARVEVPNSAVTMPNRVGAIDGSVGVLGHQFDGPCEVVHWMENSSGGGFGSPSITYRWALVRMGNAPTASFPARITGVEAVLSDVDFGPLKYRYEWAAVLPIGAPDQGANLMIETIGTRYQSSGYPEGRAWNLTEEINVTGFTTLGNGALREHIPDTFFLRPAPISTRVMMHIVRYRGWSETSGEVVLRDGHPRFVFQYENYVTGPCPEPEPE